MRTAGGHRTTPFSGSTDLNQIESSMKKQPKLYTRCGRCNHSGHCNKRRDLDKYATRLIKGSSAKEAFVSSFSYGGLNVATYSLRFWLVLSFSSTAINTAVYIINSYYKTTVTRQILKPWLRFCFIFISTTV